MDPTNQPPLYTGRVKFYDWDKGTGFIMRIDVETGQHVEDVFVHRSEIHAPGVLHLNKKLITGEIVQFEKRPPRPGKTNWQAARVRGFMDGPLICQLGTVEFSNYTRLFSRQGRDNDVTMAEETCQGEPGDDPVNTAIDMTSEPAAHVPTTSVPLEAYLHQEHT